MNQIWEIPAMQLLRCEQSNSFNAKLGHNENA